MARPISVIYKALQDGLVASAALVGITIDPTKWSKTDYKALILNTVAINHGIEEQLYDQHLSEVESVALVLPIQTSSWIKDKMLNLFEYDATAVPIVQFDTINFTPYYPNPNPSYRIIKYCSVTSGGLGRVIIKCAEQNAGVPVAMSSTKKDAAQAFVDIILGPSIEYEVVSNNSDKLFMQLDVYYNGLYSAVIQANVIFAINNYLTNIPFDGTINLSNLAIAIKSVIGVGDSGDVVFTNIQARQDSQSFGTGTDLVINNTEVNRNYQTFAGYIIPENTSGKTLTDFRVGSSGIKNLNLIAQ